MPSLLKFRNGTTNDLDSLHDQKIWFSSFEQLNDPFEGIAPIHCSTPDIDRRFNLINKLIERLERLDNSNKEEANQFRYIQALYKTERDIYERSSEELIAKHITNYLTYSRDNKTIFSCSMRLREDDSLLNPLMWAHYANSFKGFCLEFDYSKLTDHLREKEKFIGGSRVSYSKSENLHHTELDNIFEAYVNLKDSNDMDIMTRPFITKSSHWEHENEYRYILDKTNAVTFPKKALRCIYVTNRTPKWIVTYILNLISNKYPESRCYQLKNDNFEYKMNLSRLK